MLEWQKKPGQAVPKAMLAVRIEAQGSGKRCTGPGLLSRRICTPILGLHLMGSIRRAPIGHARRKLKATEPGRKLAAMGSDTPPSSSGLDHLPFG